MELENKQNIQPSPNAWVRFHDYEYALILGLIIGVFLIPVERNLGINNRIGYIYLLSVCGGPVLALAGVFIAKHIFSRIYIAWQFIKFALIGVSNTAISFGVFNTLIALTNITSGPLTALFEGVAFVFSVSNSYFWNSHWSFENKNPRTIKEFFTFLTITVIGLLISSATIYVLTTFVPHGSIGSKQWANIAKVIATIITMFWNFTGFKLIVFKEKI